MGGIFEESNIANLWNDHFSAIANSVGSTDNQDPIMKELKIVLGHNDVINDIADCERTEKNKAVSL